MLNSLSWSWICCCCRCFSVFICFPFRCNRNQKVRDIHKKTTRKNIATNDLWIRSSSVVSFDRFNVDYLIKIVLETSVHLSSFIECCNSIVDGVDSLKFSNCADKKALRAIRSSFWDSVAVNSLNKLPDQSIKSKFMWFSDKILLHKKQKHILKFHSTKRILCVKICMVRNIWWKYWHSMAKKITKSMVVFVLVARWLAWPWNHFISAFHESKFKQFFFSTLTNTKKARKPESIPKQNIHIQIVDK